jgi:excisionase family DNA binding protein
MKCIDGQDVPSVRTSDAARQLGVSFRELYALIDAKALPAYKVGRDVMLRQVDIDAYRCNQPPNG